MRQIRIANADNRDASIHFETVAPPPPPPRGVPGESVTFVRYLAARMVGSHAALVGAHGDDYSQALIDGDPEVDFESVGQRLVGTQTVYLSESGEVLHASPKVVEVIIEPDGTERERREAQEIDGNVNVERLPVRWTGRKMKKVDAVRRFVFRRTVQLKHVDGLTFDFLHSMAKELHDEDVVVLLGSGESGKEPLVFQANGSPYRAFLEGRVDGERFQLLLHLSNQELKRVSK